MAADVLARPDAAVLTVFGAGHQAEYEILALARVRDLTRVYVVTRNTAKGEGFVAALRAKGIPAELAEAEPACWAADIIVSDTFNGATV